MIATVAARLGREPSFVYDRIRLLDLILPAQDLFRSGEIMLGHAIVLARLSQDDQRRAIETEDALFTREHVLDFDPAGDGRGRERRKTRTVRETGRGSTAGCGSTSTLRTSRNCSPTQPRRSPTSRAEDEARADHVRLPRPPRREGRRGPHLRSWSWKRADGKPGSKTCENSVLGVIVVGPGRGETFQVCIDKSGARCTGRGRDEGGREEGEAEVVWQGLRARPRESSAEAKRLAAHRAEQQSTKRCAPSGKSRAGDLKLVAGAVGKMKVKTTGSVADALVKVRRATTCRSRR